MSVFVNIDNVLEITVKAAAHNFAEGGRLTIMTKSGSNYDGCKTPGVVELETWNPVTWDTFRDIERLLTPPLRQEEPPPEDTHTPPEKLEFDF